MAIFSDSIVRAVMLSLMLGWAAYILWNAKGWTGRTRWELAAAIFCAASIVVDWLFNLSAQFLLYYALVAVAAFGIVKLGRGQTAD